MGASGAMYQAQTQMSPSTNRVTMTGATHRGLPIFTGVRLSLGDLSLRRERDSGTKVTLPRRSLGA